MIVYVIETSRGGSWRPTGNVTAKLERARKICELLNENRRWEYRIAKYRFEGTTW